MPDKATMVADLIRSANFVTADKGYSSLEVHRLLDAVQEAAKTGERLTPIIEGHQFALMSYGYDADVVEALLVDLSLLDDLPTRNAIPLPATAAGSTTAASPAGSGPIGTNATPRSTGGPTERASAVQARPGQAAQPAAQAANPQSSMSAPRLGHGKEIARLIGEARFPMGRRGGTAYDAKSVDTFLDRLAAAADNGSPVGGLLSQAQFRIARRPEHGYEVSAVDEFLDSLQRVAGTKSRGRTQSAPRVKATSTASRKGMQAAIWVLLVVGLIVWFIFFS